MDKVKIGPIDYAYELVTDLHDKESGDSKWQPLFGQIEYGTGEMRISDTLPPGQRRVTTLHEVIHGVLVNAGIDDHNEVLISALAHGLVQVLRDNPALVSMITEVEGGDSQTSPDAKAGD